MATVNWIGNFYFLALHGNPAPPADQIQVIQRPGISGAGFIDLGAIPERFTLRSQIDCFNLAHAEALFALYLTLKQANPVALVKDGYNYADAVIPFAVKVLDVKQVARRAMLGCVGGLCPPSLAWLEADWSLMAIRFPEPE